MAHKAGNQDARPLINAPRQPDAVVWLVGIDDTDNLESRGTGYHSRQLAAALAGAGIAHIVDITRHQLLVDPRIRYTSHNSSLCLQLAAPPLSFEAIRAACRAYLLANAAEGSDVGLAIARWEAVPTAIETFGFSAKRDVLDLPAAEAAADAAGIPLEGLTGDHGGKIGALAAIGLRRSGRDGRLAWRQGLREARGVVTVADLLDRTGLDAVRPLHGGDRAPQRSDRIRLESWARAVMIDGQAVALLEKGKEDDDVEWVLAGRDVLRAY